MPPLLAVHRNGTSHVATDFDVVAVGIAQMDGERVAAVDHFLERDSHVPHALVEQPKRIEGLEAPHEPVGSGRLSRLDQREFMFAVNVAQHEALPAGGVPMSAHPEDLAVPFLCGDRVAHMDFPIVDLAAEALDLMFHRVPPSSPVGRLALYRCDNLRSGSYRCDVAAAGFCIACIATTPHRREALRRDARRRKEVADGGGGPGRWAREVFADG